MGILKCKCDSINKLIRVTLRSIAWNAIKCVQNLNEKLKEKIHVEPQQTVECNESAICGVALLPTAASAPPQLLLFIAAVRDACNVPFRFESSPLFLNHYVLCGRRAGIYM